MGIQSLAGQTLGQYELQDLLGFGGMGAVYRAYQPSLKRSVAIKVLSPALAQQPGYLERFEREAETAAGLEHSHIVPIYDHGTEDGTSYVVMRLLTGGTLADRMRRHQEAGAPLPSLGEVAELLEQLAGALDYAHNAGVIHRDMKPSNVMFDDQGNAFIVDFGIAKLVESTDSLTGTGISMGTPSYMAPEQWKGEGVGPATDQYSLGVMAYALCTGGPPFEAETPYALMHKHLNEQPLPPHFQRFDLPETATYVLERVLAKTPEERYPTVTDFAEAFQAAIQGATGEQTGYFTMPVSRQPTPIGPLTPEAGARSRPQLTVPVYRRPLVWGLASALVVLALGALGVFLLLDDDPTTPADLPGEQTRVQLSAVALEQTQVALGELALEQTQSAINATQTAIVTPLTPQTEGEALLLTATALSLLEPSATPTATLTATPTATLTPAATATPRATTAPSATPIMILSPTPLPGSAVGPAPDALPADAVLIPAACRAAGIQPDRPAIDQPVYITWSWSAMERPLIEEHAAQARYDVELDDTLLDDWQDYAAPPTFDGEWWTVIWRYPVGTLEPGSHTVTYRLSWAEPISDGQQTYGPGTDIAEEEGSCVFTVEAAD